MKRKPAERPKVDLSDDTISFRGRSGKLDPQLAEFLYAISKKDPEIASLDWIMRAMWGHPDRMPETADAIIRILAMHGRRKLKPLRIRLCTADGGYFFRVASSNAENLRRSRQKRSEMRRAEAEEKMIGQRFGGLVAIEPAKRSRVFIGGTWKFQCDCGAVVEVSMRRVKYGHQTSCGCRIHAAAAWAAHDKGFKVKDRTGQKFGMLTALRLNHAGGGKNAEWVVHCGYCGEESVLDTSNLLKQLGCGKCAKRRSAETRKLMKAA